MASTYDRCIVCSVVIMATPCWPCCLINSASCPIWHIAHIGQHHTVAKSPKHDPGIPRWSRTSPLIIIYKKNNVLWNNKFLTNWFWLSNMYYVMSYIIPCHVMPVSFSPHKYYHRSTFIYMVFLCEQGWLYK